jgi:hypothetical protein
LTLILRDIWFNSFDDLIEGEIEHGYRVDIGRGCFFRRLVWLGVFFRQPESGGLTVDWTTVLALFVTAILVLYLTTALLVPEKMS